MILQVSRESAVIRSHIYFITTFHPYSSPKELHSTFHVPRRMSMFFSTWHLTDLCLLFLDCGAKGGSSSHLRSFYGVTSDVGMSLCGREDTPAFYLEVDRSTQHAPTIQKPTCSFGLRILWRSTHSRECHTIIIHLIPSALSDQ